MTYAQLPEGNDVDSPSVTCIRFRTVIITMATCACGAGGAGFLGGLGSPCPPYGEDFQNRFLAGAGEDNMREVLGQLGIVFYFLVSSAFQLANGEVFCGLLQVLSCVLVFVGELTAYKLAAVVGTCSLLGSLSFSIYTYFIHFQTSWLSSRFESDPQVILIIKQIGIAGGLLVLLAMCIPATAQTKFWIAMYGRLALLVPFWEAAGSLGIDGFQVAASRLGLLATACLARSAFAIIILGSAMNCSGALVNSFFCDVTWIASIRIGQWIAVPGAELLLLSLSLVTLLGPLRYFLENKFDQRWAHLQCASQNIAIIGGLVNMTGFDAWTL